MCVVYIQVGAIEKNIIYKRCNNKNNKKKKITINGLRRSKKKEEAEDRIETSQTTVI